MKRMFLAAVMLVMAAGMSACAVSGGKAGDAQNEAVQSGDAPMKDSAGTQSPASTGSGVDAVRSGVANTVTVNSSEEVAVVPDMAEIVYCVRTKEATAVDCQRKNAEDVTQVIGLLESLGVAEASIQTSDYTMNPVYNYSGNTQKLVGYEAVTTLTVSDLLIERLDEVLSGSVTSGVNTVQSITYKASGYDESYEEALKRAVDSAHKKAQTLAEASGASVGKALRIEEISGYSDERYTDYARSGMANSYAYAKREATEDTAGFLAGEILVEAKIVVEYELVN